MTLPSPALPAELGGAAPLSSRRTGSRAQFDPVALTEPKSAVRLVVRILEQMLDPLPQPEQHAAHEQQQPRLGQCLASDGAVEPPRYRRIPAASSRRAL